MLYCSPDADDVFLISGSKIVNPFKFLEVFETWGPYIDGELIKEQAVTAFQKGHWQKEKPLLLGKSHTLLLNGVKLEILLSYTPDGNIILPTTPPTSSL